MRNEFHMLSINDLYSLHNPHQKVYFITIQYLSYKYTKYSHYSFENVYVLFSDVIYVTLTIKYDLWQ